jgi:cytidine deaminase
MRDQEDRRGEPLPEEHAGAAPGEDTMDEALDGDALDRVALDGADLVQHAREARDRAYAPYSTYPVGCALRAGDAVFSGANVENASYGLTICAERTALVQAVLAGERELDEVAVITSSSPPASPCGMCLQSLVEFCTDPAAVRVILANDRGERRDLTLAELLPHAFTPRQLRGA